MNIKLYSNGALDEFYRMPKRSQAEFLPASAEAGQRTPWQCLYFRPDPQGQGALRLISRLA